MNLFYYLNPDHTYRPCTIDEWAQQFETTDRKAAEDVINGLRVSTVWLGTNHNFLGRVPLVFETMIFDKNGLNVYMDHYTTWDEALEGHKKAIQWILDGCNDE